MIGLVAATHTPFDATGELNLDIVETQASHLLRNGIRIAFIGGTTGECHSMTLGERLALSERWFQVVKGSELRVVVHTGSNSLHDAREIASQAQKLGAIATSAFSPSYFKPDSVEMLVESMRYVAQAAPEIPFYYYDIPSMTGVHLPAVKFMEQASQSIPNLAGLKFSNPDLLTYQQLLHLDGGKWDIPFGSDEALLAALNFGATSAVGSTYNFAAPIYHRLLAAFESGDLNTARTEQLKSVRLVRKLFDVSYVAAAKEVMSLVGVDVGPPRLPCRSLTSDARSQLRSDLECMGFFDWIR